MPAYPDIDDYGILGDCHTAALVSNHGSIDWLCLPRFDSASVFGRLLDAQKGGYFSVRPVKTFTSTRTYLGHSNVLQTTFETASGVVKLTDAMPVDVLRDEDKSPVPDQEIVRKIECIRGRVELEMVFEPRFEYGRVQPDINDEGAMGFICEHRSDVLVLRTDMSAQVDPDGHRVTGETQLDQGEVCHLAMTYTQGSPAVLPVLGDQIELKISDTVSWWTNWSRQCQYYGPYREAVIRSVLTLKLMTYAPSGAIVAAPTTSLPEDIGGVRNWDYRFCWVRDASLVLSALLELGFESEAEAFLDWLLSAIWLTYPELRPLYDLHGGRRLQERELDHLEGYRGSRPVRIGNEASKQLQLDVYGEVIEAAYLYLRRGGKLDQTELKMLRNFGEIVTKMWRKPDKGIWEIRSEDRHHTYSKVMCWVALDRLLQLHEEGYLSVPEKLFREERQKIRSNIEQHGYNDEIGSYVNEFGGESVDASLLLMSIHGYIQPDDPRMTSTVKRIEEELGVNGLIYRYAHSVDDGLPGEEGAFGICSFWMVICKAMEGNDEAARVRFDQIMTHANDIGLLAEEMDPETGDALGNFPQAFTHIGMILAAQSLGQARPPKAVAEQQFGAGPPRGVTA